VNLVGGDVRIRDVALSCPGLVAAVASALNPTDPPDAADAGGNDGSGDSGVVTQAAWLARNLCQGEPAPPFARVRPLLAPLAGLLGRHVERLAQGSEPHFDGEGGEVGDDDHDVGVGGYGGGAAAEAEAAERACWALNDMAEANEARVGEVLDSGGAGHLLNILSFLNFEDRWDDAHGGGAAGAGGAGGGAESQGAWSQGGRGLRVAALKAVGAVAKGCDADQVARLVELGALAVALALALGLALGGGGGVVGRLEEPRDQVLRVHHRLRPADPCRGHEAHQVARPPAHLVARPHRRPRRRRQA
jgi:hypothetical protein